ncbi:MAG: trypsin-like peptidase domain-containing protein [Thermoanaerobaculia bacterium]|nr:trypsin-like peptidase domain-containing protein [Thermoanaerobaculia bacterium]
MQHLLLQGKDEAPGLRLRFATALALMLLWIPGCRQGPAELDQIQKMVYEVKPAVVRVNAYATATMRMRPEESEDAVDSDSEALSPPSSGVAVQTGTGGSGTGFVIHPDGWIVTSAHVIEPTIDQDAIRERLLRNGAITVLQRSLDEDVVRALARGGKIDRAIERIIERSELEDVEVVSRVDLSNGRSYEFEVEEASGSIPEGGSDLALLHVPARMLPTLSLSDSEVRLQEHIWIAGYPSVASRRDPQLGGWLSAETDLEPTITSGSITAIRRSVDSMLIYQTDAAAYPGHSGGPAVDRQGTVIGIPAWGHADADQIRFLVPSVRVRSFLKGAGIELDVEGPFDAVYRDALEAAADGRWKVAEEKLREADSLFSGSPDLRRFLNEAERARAETRFQWTDTVAIGSFVVAILVVAAAGSRLRSSSRRRPGFPPIREELVVNPARGDRSAEEAVSFREKGKGSLGTFTVLNGLQAGRRMGLGGSGIRIGRESKFCEIVLSDPKISRLHAEIVSFDGRTMLIDRNSSNGTFVNDERIERKFLDDGDIIYFGGRHAVAVAFTL